MALVEPSADYSRPGLVAARSSSGNALYVRGTQPLSLDYDDGGPDIQILKLEAGEVAVVKKDPYGGYGLFESDLGQIEVLAPGANLTVKDGKGITLFGLTV